MPIEREFKVGRKPAPEASTFQAVQSEDKERMDDTNELTYTVLIVNEINDAIYRELASLLNVRLAYQGNYNFPYIPFEKFETLSKVDKLFVHGPGGSGKSRCIFEILKKNMGDYRKIFIINPRNTTEGKHRRATLKDLISKFGELDAVVWDNFPDDLRKRDLSNSILALELISSRSTKQLLVSLKPKYLEVFASLTNNIPEFYPLGISYNKEEFKEIIKSYGAKVPQYQNAYEQFLEPNLDTIAKSLWQKEPIPLTILDYYSELIREREREIMKSDKNGVIQKYPEAKATDPISLAKKLPRSVNYYDHQFVLLNHMEDRTSDVEFLYTLKLCYELKLDRTRYKVEELQREVFGSSLKSYPRLRNWVYLSGQICSMHDVCRDAITLTADLKSRFLHFIANNFKKVVTDDDPSRVNAVALFLGRNVDYLPRDQVHPFLPETIYKYMKMNPQFEKWFGRSVGEVFDSLDEDLQKIITSRVDTDIHFAVGLGDSLGYRFSSIKKENPILKKINDDFLFARYFGQSLGRLFPYLPDDLREQVTASSKYNPQLSDGLGMGIGFIYGTLDPDLKKEMFAKAETNSEMMRGLGYGFGLRFSDLKEKFQDEIFSRGDVWSEFDFGLGFALGEQYKNLTSPLQQRVLDRIEDHPLFSFGIGLYAGFADPNNCPSELLTRMRSNGGLSFGLGLGFGISFDYLTTESRASLLTEATKNIRLDIGLGEGFGLVFNLLNQEKQKMYLMDVDSNGAFAEGLASGIGNTWIYNKYEIQERATSKIATNNLFAYGLGFGIGHRMNYFDGEARSQVLTWADRNSELDEGLGLGLGMVFPYLGAQKNEVLSRASKRSSFAYGLGTGVGWIYKYLTAENKGAIIPIISSSSRFARGLGHGIGVYTVNHCDADLVNQFFYMTKEDGEFAHGLGEGFGYSFGYCRKVLQKKVLNYAMTASAQFARGLGVGFGKSLRYLSPNLKNNIFRSAEDNVNFAEGLGEGVGSVFPYMNDNLRKELFSKAAVVSTFAKGLGIGLGSVFSYLSPQLENEILFQRTIQNSQFAKGLGIGLGSVFSYQSPLLKNTILKRTEDNANLAEGLGEGIGSVFGYIESSVQKDIIQRAEKEKNPTFLKGIGIGLGLIWKYCHSNLNEIVQTHLLNNEFAAGFGIGAATIFPYLSKTSDSGLSLLALVEKNVKFAESFGFGVAHFFTYMTGEQRGTVTDEGERLFKNISFAYGLGKGLGHKFLHMDEKLKEEVFEKIKDEHFAYGFGRGLGRIFNSLEAIVQNKILEYVSHESTFAYGLGKGLGHNFPSLTSQIQHRILKLSERVSSFTSGLMSELEGVIAYLSGDIKVMTLMFIEQHRGDSSRSTGLREDTNDVIYDEFPAIGLLGRSHRLLQQHYEQQVSTTLPLTDKEIVFLGTRKKCCVCFIDIVGSTKITDRLKQEQIQSYYATFLNAMATISKNFNADIIKSQGDALFLYFPRTSASSIRPANFKDVLECGITMIAAHKAINAVLYERKLPTLDYRISADYGTLEEARSTSSKGLDLFGPAMNLCVKINSKAGKNEMVVGYELYDKVKSFYDIYSFKEAEGFTRGDDGKLYPVFHVKYKKRDILNPFERKSN